MGAGSRSFRLGDRLSRYARIATSQHARPCGDGVRRETPQAPPSLPAGPPWSSFLTSLAGARWPRWCAAKSPTEPITAYARPFRRPAHRRVRDRQRDGAQGSQVAARIRPHLHRTRPRLLRRPDPPGIGHHHRERLTTVLIAILSVVILLVIGGCVCVYWTARGDAPRWARGVAGTTQVLSRLVLAATSKSRSSSGDSD